MELILKYFKNLSTNKVKQIEQLADLYKYWNEKINVISRKDMDNFYERHVLHSLAIAKLISFKPNTKIIDIGTGGGFPGIPLAILFPETEFTLIDSTGKKIKVVKAISEALQLKNVSTIQIRSEEHKGKYDFIVSRAVTNMPNFVKNSQHLIAKKGENSIGNGILYLKGGDLSNEIAPFKNIVSITELNDFFEEPFFSTKALIHIPL
ncbi:16S rRNA (guanine(527)-N(7))-methyltransferase RsmG [Marinilabiliaceae bacterium ANBcel2]|nr:16S rRNA (guanine(527)-N(7))-methyltransferase RsmG [Marinilabiliaceae bacterium ANBcel2]